MMTQDPHQSWADPNTAWPDPLIKPEFYADVPAKRLIAWVIDSLIVGILTAIIVPFTGFTALFFLPLLISIVSLVYRSASLSRWAATPGMAFVAIEFRAQDGLALTPGLAFVHSLAYILSTAFVLPQVVSVGLMVVTQRRQGLSDLVLGTVVVNRSARN
jgi:uncharacterized RDD family membrane protein YckC